MELIGENGFEDYTKEGASEFADNYGIILNMVFEVKQHSMDRQIEWSIKNYLRFVRNQNDLQKTPAY